MYLVRWEMNANGWRYAVVIFYGFETLKFNNMKTKEQIASEWAGLKLDIFTDTNDLKHIHPYITPKQCLRAMDAYAQEVVKNNAVLPLVSNCAFIAEDPETEELIIVNAYTIEEAISILEANGYPSTTEIRYKPLKSLHCC
jgi:hypothetical protein